MYALVGCGNGGGPPRGIPGAALLVLLRYGAQAPRRTAPVRSDARATAASRAAVASSTVSVRSSARNFSAYARDLVPSSSWSPV